MTAAQMASLLDDGNCARCYADLSTLQMLKAALLDRVGKLYVVYRFIQLASITDQTQINALNQLVLSAYEHGWWDKCDLIYPFVGGTAGAHSINLKSPGNYTISWNGAVTHDSNGITGDGATGYGDTGYIPSSSGQAKLNSASVSTYRRSHATAGRQYLNSRGASATHQLGISEGGVNTTVRLNEGGVAAASTELGFVGGSRTSGASRFVILGGVVFNSSVAPNTIPGVSMYVVASNQNGVPALFLDANISSATVGSALTESEMQLMASDWQTFQTALGRQV